MLIQVLGEEIGQRQWVNVTSNIHVHVRRSLQCKVLGRLNLKRGRKLWKDTSISCGISKPIHRQNKAEHKYTRPSQNILKHFHFSSDIRPTCYTNIYIYLFVFLVTLPCDL